MASDEEAILTNRIQALDLEKDGGPIVNPKGSLLTLPNETLVHIFEYLDLGTLCSLCITSRRLKELVSEMNDDWWKS